jgi:hypothetical protein
MPLTMRPTGLASPVDKDRQDFTIYCGGLAMGIFGRVSSVSGGSEPLHELIQPVAVVRRKNHTAIEDCTAAPFAPSRSDRHLYGSTVFAPFRARHEASSLRSGWTKGHELVKEAKGHSRPKPPGP